MLYKPARVTVTPGSPGQAGRDASYECTTYATGGASDGGGYSGGGSDEDTGGSGGESGVCFSGIGSPYTPAAGEWVYVGEGCSYEEQQVADPGDYECVWGTSDPVSTPYGTTYITGPFCSLKSGGFSGGA